MITAIASVLAGVLLKSFQVLIDSSLYLLIGFLAAGAIRSMADPARLRQIFGNGRPTAPLRAWALASLAPICSLGVIPVLVELRRAGVARSAILTFALAAPILNPVSLLSGFSYLGPQTLLILVLGTFIVSVGAGILAARLGGPEDTESERRTADESNAPAAGPRRMAAALAHAARETSGPSILAIGAGALGGAIVCAFLSAPTLAGSMFVGDPWAIPRMMIVAPLPYVTPEQGMVMIPEMMKFRQSAGAMLIVLTMGVGLTLAQAVWVRRSYGVRTAGAWLGLAIGLTVAASYAIESVVPPVGTANADNDHFIVFANPIESDHSLENIGQSIARHLNGIELMRWASFATFMTLFGAGLIFKSAKGRAALDAFLSRPSATATEATVPAAETSVWSRPLPPSLIRGTCGAAILALGTAGAYAYYPSPEEAFRDMQIIQADCFGELAAPTSAPSLHHLDLWDRQAAKLPIGAWLRLSPPASETLRRNEELRAALRSLRALLEQGELGKAKTAFPDVQIAYDRCRDAYLGGTTPVRRKIADGRD